MNKYCLPWTSRCAIAAASFPLRERCATTSSKGVFRLFAESPVAPESIATRNKMVFALFNSLLKFVFMEILSRSDLQGHGPTFVMTRKARDLFRTRRQNLASPKAEASPALRSERHAPAIWLRRPGRARLAGR